MSASIDASPHCNQANAECTVIVNPPDPDEHAVLKVDGEVCVPHDRYYECGPYTLPRSRTGNVVYHTGNQRGTIALFVEKRPADPATLPTAQQTTIDTVYLPNMGDNWGAGGLEDREALFDPSRRDPYARVFLCPHEARLGKELPKGVIATPRQLPRDLEISRHVQETLDGGGEDKFDLALGLARTIRHPGYRALALIDVAKESRDAALFTEAEKLVPKVEGVDVRAHIYAEIASAMGPAELYDDAERLLALAARDPKGQAFATELVAEDMARDHQAYDRALKLAHSPWMKAEDTARLSLEIADKMTYHGDFDRAVGLYEEVAAKQPAVVKDHLGPGSDILINLGRANRPDLAIRLRNLITDDEGLRGEILAGVAGGLADQGHFVEANQLVNLIASDRGAYDARNLINDKISQAIRVAVDDGHLARAAALIPILNNTFRRDDEIVRVVKYLVRDRNFPEARRLADQITSGWTKEEVVKSINDAAGTPPR